MYFGEHIIIDGYGGKKELLDDDSIICRCLNELPALLGMKKLTEPVIHQAPENDKKDPGGWSGFVIINESHISIHTFPNRGFLSADVYTCRNGLNQKFIERFFREAFDLSEIESHFIKRGTRYPSVNIF